MTTTETPHSEVGTPTYYVWANIVQRTGNRSNPKYKQWGGRGIGMYGPWRRSYMAFKRSVGTKPKGKTLDRIDVNKGYVPGNVRWASKATQASNMTSNRYVIVKGKRMTETAAAKRFGLSLQWLVTKLNHSNGRVTIQGIKIRRTL